MDVADCVEQIAIAADAGRGRLETGSEELAVIECGMEDDSLDDWIVGGEITRDRSMRWIVGIRVMLFLLQEPAKWLQKDASMTIRNSAFSRETLEIARQFKFRQSNYYIIIATCVHSDNIAVFGEE